MLKPKASMLSGSLVAVGRRALGLRVEATAHKSRGEQ
jgi:hypothetical protein